MKIEFTQELIDKLRNYCEINTINILGKNEGSRKAQYYAEEALSELLLAWQKKNIKNNWKKENFTDNFYFISCKNYVKNSIDKETRIKRKVWSDYNNVQLDKPIEGDITYEFESNYEEDLDKIKIRELEVEAQLEFIVKTLNNCDWITQFDIDIFHWVFVEGKTLVSFAKKEAIAFTTVSQSKNKVLNVIKYLWDDTEN